MKKVFFGVVALFLVISLAGCKTEKSYTYEVSTGDDIKVTIDTTDGYNYKEKDESYAITKKDDTICEWTFVTMDGYNSYIELYNNSDSATLIKDSSNDNIDYSIYRVNNTAANMIEYDNLIKVKNSNTAIIMGSFSEENMNKCLELISFELVK